MKLSKRYFLCTVVMLAAILFMPYGTSSSYAYPFEFQWTANHANDQVDLYHIYWGWGSLEGDNPSPAEDMLEVDDGGLVSPQILENITWEIPEVTQDDIVCFVVTATDNEGFESDYSNQLCFGPVVADFIILEDNFTSYKPSGWADAGAYVEIYLEGGTNPIGFATADEYGAWTATDGIDFSGLPEGEIILYASSNDKESGHVPGIMDTAIARFSAGPGAVDITNTSATIEWSTSETTKTVLEYRTADESLPEEEKIFGQRSDNNYLIDHSMEITGLRLDTRFYYRVRATDTAGNELISSERAFKTLSGPDTTAPQVSTPVVGKIVSHDSAPISWNVNEYSTNILAYGTQPGIYPLNVTDEGGGLRTVVLTGLNADTTYYFRVQATDTNGNGPTYTIEQSFKTLLAPDTTPPVIDETSISLEELDYRSATITWETDEFSNSIVAYGLTPSYGQSVTVDTLEREAHSVRIVALQASTKYYYRVGSSDGAENGPTYSEGKSFTTPEAPDTTLPSFDSPLTVDVTDKTATITWLTDEDSTSSVRYGTESFDWDVGYQFNKDDIILKTVHSVELTGLNADTIYYYRVGITDGAENGPTLSPQGGYFRTETTPDVSPPEFTSQPTVTGKTDATAVIRWTTDEKSTSLLNYGPEDENVIGSPYDSWGDYPSFQNSAELVTEHEVTLTNLMADATYYVMVRSYDGLDNGPAESQEVSFTTFAEGDYVRPRITMPPTLTGISNTSVMVVWETDEPANGEVRFDTSRLAWEEYANVVIDDRKDEVHRVVLTNLDPETRYYFRVGSTDADGNGPGQMTAVELAAETNNPFVEEVFKTLDIPDTTAPQILEDGPVVAAVDANSAIITWQTNEPSNSLVQYGSNGSSWVTLTSSASDGTMVESHMVTLTGLDANTTYSYMVGSQDAAGNGPFVNADNTNPWPVKTFTTTNAVDTFAPHITNMQMTFATDTTALITWDTDEPSNSLVKYGNISRTTWEGYAYEESDAEMRTRHSTTITNLQPGTNYVFRIGSTDAKGNGPTYNSVPGNNPSIEGQFTTNAFPDTEAPQIAGDVNISVNVATRTAVVTWETQDEPGNSQVQYDYFSRGWGGYAYSENDPEMVFNHRVTLTNLSYNILYYIRVSSVDASGNNYNASYDDLNPSLEYNFRLVKEADSASESPGSTVEEIQDDIEEIATCFIHSVRKDIPDAKMLLLTFSVLLGMIGLIKIRMRSGK